MSVVAEDEGGDAAFRIPLEGEPGSSGTIEVKKRGWGRGGKFRDFALQVLLVELIALAENRYHDMAFQVAILAGQAVKQRRGQLDGWGMEWNDQALRQRKQLRNRLCGRGVL